MERSPHLTVVRPDGNARREQAVSRARSARRRLEGRPEQAADRFGYLRRAHD